jgi:toxin HigB-1
VTKPPRRQARRARGAGRKGGILEQDVDRPSGEPARRQACRSDVSAVAVEAFVNYAGSSLNKLFQDDDGRKVPGAHREKITRILARLNEARTVQDMALPGYQLHPLKGNLAGLWSVSVSGNWRIVFRFEDGMAEDVELIDYH